MKLGYLMIIYNNRSVEVVEHLTERLPDFTGF